MRIIVQRLCLVCLGCHLGNGIVDIGDRCRRDFRARKRDICRADHVVDIQIADLAAGETERCIALEAAREVACGVQIMNIAAADGDVGVRCDLMLDRAAV